MAAYLVATLDVTDAGAFARYAAAVPSIVASHGGRYIARGGATELLEGDAPVQRVVVIEFDTLDAARAYYHSPDYQRARELRAGAATGALFITDGITTHV
ncbi:DUF1330 domain-containing protein [Amycolatopsis thermoflava]|uniref:DUF1330 domain-containing protein n=1 Tax=Amycolatopsis thermoflava TaxID=84480 RepID=UPI003805C7F5